MATRRSATLKVTSQQAIGSNSQKFTQNILNLNVLACCPRNPTDADLEKAAQEARLGLKALNSYGALQEMLAAQMLSIHQFQQQVSSGNLKEVEYTHYTSRCIVQR